MLALSVFAGVIFNVFVIGLVSIFALARRRQMFRARPVLSGLFGAFWLLSMIVTAIYGGRRMLLLTALLLFAYIVLIYISYAMTAKAFDAIAVILSFATVPSLIVAIIQAAMHMTWSYGARYCSVFYNANFYGMVCALTILACIYNIIRSEKRGMIIVYSVFIAMNCVGIYMTASRVALVAAFVGVSVLLALSGKWKAFICICAVFAVALALDNWLGARFDILPRMDEMSESFHGRYSIWMTALDSIRSHPVFGVGTFSYGRVCQETGGWFADHAHNLILELTLDYGYVGLMLVSAIMFYLLGRSLELYHDKEGRPRMAVAMSVFVSVLLSGMLDLSMLWPQTAAIIAFMINVPVTKKPLAPDV